MKNQQSSYAITLANICRFVSANLQLYFLILKNEQQDCM